jgi:hypothetical protein
VDSYGVGDFLDPDVRFLSCKEIFLV